MRVAATTVSDHQGKLADASACVIAIPPWAFD
jgi:hypothetical protein